MSGDATRERLERVMSRLETLVDGGAASAPEALRLRNALAEAEADRSRLKAQNETAAGRLDAAILQLRSLLGD